MKQAAILPPFYVFILWILCKEEVKKKWEVTEEDYLGYSVLAQDGQNVVIKEVIYTFMISCAQVS